MRTLATILAAGAIVLAFAPFVTAPLFALAAAVAAALVVEPALLRTARTLRFLLLALVFAVLTGALIAYTGGAARGLTRGIGVFGRTAVLPILADLASRNVNAERLLALSAHLRLQRLGLVLSLALNAFPHLVEAWREAWVINPEPITVRRIPIAATQAPAGNRLPLATANSRPCSFSARELYWRSFSSCQGVNAMVDVPQLIMASCSTSFVFVSPHDCRPATPTSTPFEPSKSMVNVSPFASVMLEP